MLISSLPVIISFLVREAHAQSFIIFPDQIVTPLQNQGQSQNQGGYLPAGGYQGQGGYSGGGYSGGGSQGGYNYQQGGYSTISGGYEAPAQGGYSSGGYGAPQNQGGYQGGGYSGGYGTPRNEGYSYPVPSNPLLYPGQSANFTQLQDSSESLSSEDKSEDSNSDFFESERNRSNQKGSSRNTNRNKEELRRTTTTTPSSIQEEQITEDPTEGLVDDGDLGLTREDALNQGANLELNEELGGNRAIEGGVEEGVFGGGLSFLQGITGGNGGLGERLLAGPDGNENEEGASTNLQSTKTNSNKDLFNKAYGIGRKDDEGISGSSIRSQRLQQSFSKNIKAPSYGGLGEDDEDGGIGGVAPQALDQKAGVKNVRISQGGVVAASNKDTTIVQKKIAAQSKQVKRVYRRVSGPPTPIPICIGRGGCSFLPRFKTATLD